MKLNLYQIDAFANHIFEGNPAAVCPLDKWLPDELMQAIAAENNLSETAFFVTTETGYAIRWFAPLAEVELCGHATLASAYVIFNILGDTREAIHFDSKSGVLTVTQTDDLLAMDFPAQPIEACETPDAIIEAFGHKSLKCAQREDYIVFFEHEADVAAAAPDMTKLSQLDLRGVAITAPSNEYDFVMRFFAPKYGINEDSVTGSAYTQLAPYWAEVLGKAKLRAKQISKRGGVVNCSIERDRVVISGTAVKYMEAIIEV